MYLNHAREGTNRTGDKWCIYSHVRLRLHGESDSIEGVTHSICTLEFEIHRPLYDWYLESLGIYPPAADRVRPGSTSRTTGAEQAQKLIQLVSENHVSGWDDPRMPTICGVIRRRGYHLQRRCGSSASWHWGLEVQQHHKMSRGSKTPCARTWNKKAPQGDGRASTR